jgi:RTX toxin RtxA
MGRGESTAEWVVEYAAVERAVKTLACQFEAELSQEEASALRSYSRNVHKPVNAFLRGLDDDRIVAESWIPLLDAALAKAQAASCELRLYRSFVSKPFFFRSLQRGRQFVDEGYCSTSTSRDLARTFGGGAYEVRLEILVPEGALIAPLGDLADNPYEMEVLLPRGSRFKVERDRRSLIRRERELQVSLLR